MNFVDNHQISVYFAYTEPTRNGALAQDQSSDYFSRCPTFSFKTCVKINGTINLINHLVRECVRACVY